MIKLFYELFHGIELMAITAECENSGFTSEVQNMAPFKIRIGTMSTNTLGGCIIKKVLALFTVPSIILQGSHSLIGIKF